MTSILKVIVGSQAHGLATPESDFDYRGVFMLPTSEILSLGGSKQTTSWVEGKDDDTSWELSHFLHLATKSNPTILETFLAPVVEEETTPLGYELRKLFPKVWNSTDVLNAFRGYSINQRKKMLEDKDGRGPKYAAAYLRTLYQGIELLRTGTFTIRIADTEIGTMLRAWRQGDYSMGEVIDACRVYEQMLQEAYNENPDKTTDFEAVNTFILEARKNNW